MLGDVAEGIGYLRQHRETLYLVIGATLVNFCVVPAFALLPLFVMQELGGGAYYLSVVQLVFGIGGVIGGSLLAGWGGFQRRIVTVLAGFACMGLASLLLGVAPGDSNWMPATAMFMVGAAAAIINGAVVAILQSIVAADYQGRLFTLLASIAGAMTPIALLLAAPVAELLGIRFWYLAGGVSCMLVALAGTMIPTLAEMSDEVVDTA